MVAGRCALLCFVASPLLHCTVEESGEWTYSIEGDEAIITSTDPNYVAPIAAPGAQLVYLNFDGAALREGNWASDNAQTNTSFIVKGTAQVPAFDASPWGDRQSVINTIVNATARHFDGFQVSFTTSRPSSGNYTMIVMGGRPENIGRQGAGGIAPIDPGNQNPSDVGFVFTSALADSGYRAEYIATFVAHEFGHSFGLRHLPNENQVMNPVGCHCNPSWGEGMTVASSGSPSVFQRDTDVMSTVFLEGGGGSVPGGGGNPGGAGAKGRTRGDFDGNGMTDVAVWRPSEGSWWPFNTAPSVYWGQTGDLSASADYNGDGRTEIAIWRPSDAGLWVLGAEPSIYWGQAGDLPAPGDYNGDGRDEFAIWRPSTGEWWIAGSPAFAAWGAAGDLPAPADYNGDGITDVAVWRPSTGELWLYNQPAALVWGQSGDYPVPGDYNGDGRDDFAVWRPSTGEWWFYQAPPIAAWGQPGDLPAF